MSRAREPARGLRWRARGARPSAPRCGWPLPVLWLVAAICSACSPTLVWYGYSADRRSRVEVVEGLDGQRVRRDGVDGPTFRGIPIESVVLSDDGRHLAYGAEADDGWHVIVDGRLGPAHDGLGSVVLSADGKHVAYAALHGSRWRVMHDGRPGPLFLQLLEGSLRFSDDGLHLAYAARGAAGTVAVLDGTAGPVADGIASLTFLRPDGGLAYVERRGERSRLVVDGEAGPLFEGIGEVLASDGRVAYAAFRDPQWVAVVDGAEQSPYRRVDALRFSPGAERLAYVAKREDGLDAMVVNGAEIAAYGRIARSTVAFSPDGRLCWVAEPADKQDGQAAADGAQRMVCDGEPGPLFDRIQPPVFAATGRRAGYVAWRSTRAYVVVDGRVLGPYAWADDLRFSSDGQHLAYAARRGRQHVVVHDDGGSAVEPIVAGSLALDRTGQHWGCLVAVRDARQIYLVVDGVPRRPFDLGELAAALARLPPTSRALGRLDAEWIHAWVEAELNLSLYE